MKKNRKYSFFINLFIALATIVVIVLCAYFTLDKAIVPKYFGEYGINNMHDLVAMVTTLYKSPKEDDLVKYGFSTSDTLSAERKMKEAGVPTTESGDIDYWAFDTLKGDGFVSGKYYFTDKEVAAFLDEMLASQIMVSKLPDIRYLNTLRISILELMINPTVVGEEDGKNVYSDSSASVSFTFKLDTSSVRNQMAKEMDTPLFLVKMIVPDTMYITVHYDIKLDEKGEWQFESGKLAINGRTEKDSEILLNLLIEFIFPPEDEMTSAKLTTECGNIMVEGLNLIGNIGNMRLYTGKSGLHGVVLTIE